MEFGYSDGFEGDDKTTQNPDEEKGRRFGGGYQLPNGRYI
jgi:hypothetical protein